MVEDTAGFRAYTLGYSQVLLSFACLNQSKGSQRLNKICRIALQQLVGGELEDRVVASSDHPYEQPVLTLDC
jgi:hypothetical protein